MPLLESSLAAGAIFLGTESLKLIGEAAKSYVKKRFESFLGDVEKRLGKKERDALELAYADAMANGFSAALDALSNILGLTGMDEVEMRQHRTEVLVFLEDENVAELLWESIADLTNPQKPEPLALEARWAETKWALPLPGSAVWPMFAANFREQAKKRAFVTPQLREILVAETIDRIAELQQQLLGVQTAVRQDQYVRVMRKKYAQVELANIAPAYAEDPGVLIVTDIFEPQHVRVNPPAVEITKDELEKLVRERKIDRNDEDAVIALLEEDEGQEVAERLKFQRTSYAEQPVRPVLSAIAPLELLTTRGFTKYERLHVITGEPGSGKSTLLRYLLLGILQPPANPEHSDQPMRWTRGFTGEYEHFPLLIELRDYYFTCRDEAGVNCFLDYVNYLGESQGWGLNAQWLHDRLTNGRSLVMFDGLDEIFDKRDRDTVMKQIAGFAETYPRASVIVTSRPHGYRDGILRPAGFIHFRLQDLDAEQKERFVRAWFARVFPKSQVDQNARVERVLGAVRRSPSVRWLAGNPLLLTIMCLIGREKELPRERARFYEECVDVLVHKWDLNHHLHIGGLEFLSIDDKKELLRRIAFHMQGSNGGLRGNFIGEGELHTVVEKWFREEHELAKHEAKLAARQMVQGLWERNYLLCPRGPKLYGFLHRTFMEYLTAMEFVRRFQATKDFTIEDLNAVFLQHGNEPEWAEVLRLICGAIGDEWAEGLIRTLFTLKPFPTKTLKEENQPNHLVLAIRCMGELRVLAKMEALGVFALEKCIQFLRVAKPRLLERSFMVTEFLDAVAEIGERWPGRNQLQQLIPKSFGRAKPDRSIFIPQFESLIQPDRDRIESYAITHPDWTVKYNALIALAERDAWADDNTRKLLRQRAIEDEHPQLRLRAFELLAGRDEWADGETRQLLRQHALEDELSAARSKALQLLAGREDWADEETRELLRQRALVDEDFWPRSTALELLASREGWAESWREAICALKTQIRGGKNPDVRGWAATTWFQSRTEPQWSESVTDEFAATKGLVFTRDIDGILPYLDPWAPVSDEHLKKVQENARPEPLSDEQLQQMVEEMNAELGWDIRKGLQAD